MSKRGGFPGGMGIPGNMNNLLKQAQRMQNQTIDKDAVDPDDVETLQDMIMAALNEAMKQVDDESEKLFGGMTGGMGF